MANESRSRTLVNRKKKGRKSRKEKADMLDEGHVEPKTASVCYKPVLKTTVFN